MFLQIRDEGRLTDSRGATAFFPEAGIVPTSEIGIVVADRATGGGVEVAPPDSFEPVQSTPREGERRHVGFERRRAAPVTRIGRTIAVFDFVHAGSARPIFAKRLERVPDAIGAGHAVQVIFTAGA